MPFTVCSQSALCLFNRPDFKKLATDYSEPTFWLLGPSSRETFEAIQAGSSQGSLISKAFPESGYYLLQWRAKGSGKEISVVFDCGDLGYKSNCCPWSCRCPELHA